MSKMFDTYQSSTVARDAARVKADGYGAVALYLFRSSDFKQPITAADVKALAAQGLYLVSVWENGSPTSGGYFGSARGAYDAEAAIAEAKALGQPPGSALYFTVDYDAPEGDLAAITAYFAQVHARVKAAGFLVGGYGSGLVLQHLLNEGLIERTWLTESRGFTDYVAFRPHADIVQSASGPLLGMDIDADATDGSAGGWILA